MATTNTEKRFEALSTTVNQKGELRPTFFKTLTTSEQVKTAVPERLSEKTRLSARLNPFWYCG